MKTLVLIILCSLACNFCLGQNRQSIDSLKHQLVLVKQDTNRVILLSEIGYQYRNFNADSGILYLQQSLSLARKINFIRGEARALGRLGANERARGNLIEALDMSIKSLNIAEKNGFLYDKARALNLIGLLYGDMNDYQKALRNHLTSLQLFEIIDDKENFANLLSNTSRDYLRLNQLDSALYYGIKSNKAPWYENEKVRQDFQYIIQLLNLGDIYKKMGNNQFALAYYQQGLREGDKDDHRTKGESYNRLATYYKEINKPDSCIYYAKKALFESQQASAKRTILISSSLLSEMYELKDSKEALRYYKIATAAKDSLFGIAKVQGLQKLFLDQQERQQKIETERTAYQNQLKQYAFLGGLVLLSLIAFILYRNNQQNRKTNKILENTLTDLKTSQAELEIKNRDLEIEAALEKIRSASLAMHHSDEIESVVSVLFEKLKELGLVFDGGAAIHVFSEDSKDAAIWVVSPQQPPTKINLPYDEVAFEDNPIIQDVWHAKETGNPIFNKIYPFEEKNKYFHYVFKHNDYTKVPEVGRNFILNAPNYTASFVAEKNSLLGANSWTGQLFSETDFGILKRVARVFEQAYVRFLDLQKAETQAREAQIEVALEMIRSRSLAMHHSEELKEVMAIMFKKMSELEVLLSTIAIQLFDTNTMDSDLWIGNNLQDPIKIRLPYNEKMMNEDSYLKYCWEAKTKGESFFNKIESFEQKNLYFNEYVFVNNDENTIPRPVREFIMKAKTHCICLIIEKNSALFADSYDGQIYSETQIEILKKVAKVFEQTYIRFLDLQKAEAQAEQAHLDLIQIQTEKKRAEDALTILKATQTQLIQSEKLASLGELTAGIAHEIQNPLNFVNNFSELSVDLAKELKEEIKKPEKDWELIDDLTTDLTENQEKINHHGKRASSIVKGMLEHSRTSTGVKELTDINALADEYLRLAYHGLRAKDNFFNATLETHFDENLLKIEVIPQDMGRVLLNLINNAFWAVKTVENPLVVVKTEHTENQLIISVSDNGTGMTDEIKAKIFQPFFTTKPTGQGTGLGLSLAYDIITKGHGGTIEVESVEGKGSTFIIKLPIKNS